MDGRKYTYRELCVAARRMLEPEDGENAEFVARQLVAAAAGRSLAQLVADYNLSAFRKDVEKTADMIRRHLQGEPVAYILGTWEFCGIPLTVTPDVLIPRDDTEALVDLALDAAKRAEDKKSIRVLDLCTGSGCVGIALARRLPYARVTLGDISNEALRVAKKNVQDQAMGGRISCMKIDVRLTADPFLGTFDIITANPPYITRADMKTLDRSVRDYEPELALNGGEDGLDYYRCILDNFMDRLAPGGCICFEFGMGQDQEVYRLLTGSGLLPDRIVRDSGGIARSIRAYRKAENAD